MFEISWSELLILGIVTLIFVGPKELPVFLRTLGKYAGMMRRHANDFKAQFDAAMREAELDTMLDEVAAMQARVNSEVMGAKHALSDAASPPLSQPASVPASLKADANPQPVVTAAGSNAPDQVVGHDLAMPPMPAPPRMGS